MKRLPLFAAAALAGLLLAANTASAQTTMKFCSEDKQVYPSLMGNSAEILKDKPGTVVEIIQLAAADLGVKAEFTRTPWRRCLESLKSNEFDAIFAASFSEARLEFGAYPMKDGKVDGSQRVDTYTYSIYRKKGSAVNWDGKAFSNLEGPVGAPVGYSIVGDLKKLGVTVDESGDTEANLRKLAAGRIAAAALLKAQVDSMIRAGKVTDIEAVPTPLSEKDYFVMLSSQFVAKNPELAKKLWQRMGEIRAARGAELQAKY